MDGRTAGLSHLSVRFWMGLVAKRISQPGHKSLCQSGKVLFLEPWMLLKVAEPILVFQFV